LLQGYYRGLLWCILVCGLVLLGYYYYDKTSVSSIATNTTQYQYQHVDGPIQPIPQLVGFNSAWVQLGKALFNSKLLSKDNSTACSSCHMLEYGGMMASLFL
jgi:cytochrome c peroxidase